MKSVIIWLGLLLFTATAFGGDTCNYIKGKTWTTKSWKMECTRYPGTSAAQKVELTGTATIQFTGERNSLTFHHYFHLQGPGTTYYNAFELGGYCAGGTIELRGDNLNSLRMVIENEKGPIEVKRGRFGLFTTDPNHDCTFSNLTFN